MDKRTLKKNVGIVTSISLASDLLMMVVHLMDKDEKIPGIARKAINVAGVTGVNAAWSIAPLTAQRRLRKPWSTAARALGTALMFSGAYIGFSSTLSRKIIGVETPESLVSEGMYRHMRHPTYAAIIAGSLGWSFFERAPHAAVALLPLAAQMLIGGLYEENLQLKPLFGEDYEAYRQRTPFFPRPLTLFLAAVYSLALCAMNNIFLAEEKTGGLRLQRCREAGDKHYH
jgi:protein-S-isoprenylcysteine O-methyltransferase Ste14